MRHCIVGVIGLVAAVPAFGQVTLLSQERSVHAVWTGGNQTIEAPDFSPFDATVGDLEPEFGETAALASQQSTLGPSLFSYVGEARAYRSGSLAESLLEVGFSVASPVEFNFDATMAPASIFGSGALSAVLTGPDGEVFSGTTFSIPGKNREIHEAGVLAPGMYTLSLFYSVNGVSTSVVIGSEATAAMSFIPAPSVAGILACSLLASRRRRH